MIDKLMFWRDSDDGNDRPPKPEPKSVEREREFTVCEVELEYRNGDTETFESYGVPHRDADRVVYKVDVQGRYSTVMGRLAFKHDHRTVSYEVLSREPKMDELCTERWKVTAEIGHVLRHEHVSWKRTKWEETVNDIQTEQIE